MGCGQAQRTAGEEDRSAEERREGEVDRGTGDENGKEDAQRMVGDSVDRCQA